ncbi:hypothetical protein [Methanoculleus chikugoensis]|uniref:hypothetical protein n=1 Tax=Methanoculleus chikugoensis TaxID=118126 RepID=UPI001FB1F5C0|nr:hypothetical protein [Methanoculleus chikugoensis]
MGPGTSAELEAVRTYADEHGFILISTMSTAPSLAIAGDNVYRLVPPDTYQADVMAYYLREQGVTAIVPVWRGDVWGGDELEKLTAAALVRGGGKVLDGVRYTPDQVYGAIAADLDARVARAIAAHGREKVAVYLVSLDEADRIMGAAMATENLPKVRCTGATAASSSIRSLQASPPALRSRRSSPARRSGTRRVSRRTRPPSRRCGNSSGGIPTVTASRPTMRSGSSPWRGQRPILRTSPC